MDYPEGKELADLVATRVMGWTKGRDKYALFDVECWLDDGEFVAYAEDYKEYEEWTAAWSPQDDYNAAFQVVEKMWWAHEFVVTIRTNPKGHSVSFMTLTEDIKEGYALGPICTAICHAALEAKA